VNEPVFLFSVQVPNLKVGVSFHLHPLSTFEFGTMLFKTSTGLQAGDRKQSTAPALAVNSGKRFSTFRLKQTSRFLELT
jgi:hypothetical protein